MPEQADNNHPKEPPGTTDEQTFDDIVKRFEREFLPHERYPNVDLFIELIDSLEQKLINGGLLENGTPIHTVENRYTRIATAITRIATSPDLSVTYDQMNEICRRKQQIAYIFSASGYRNMGHLVGLVGAEESGQYRINLKRAAVLLCFLGIDDVPDELMDTALNQPPRVALALMLGWLNQRAVLTGQGEKNRSRLLLAGASIAEAEISDREIPLIVNAWMYSSYASEPRKHDIKKAFNSLLVRRLVAAGVAGEYKERQVVERPTLLVIHERFITPHAMYRCYAPLIEQLRPNFRLVALAEEEHIDDGAEHLFEHITKIPKPRPSVAFIADVVGKIRPDVIYYPSLGMSHWTVMLAQLRLAPIQIASLGHPATTMINAIDYIYTSRMEGDLTQVFSERVLVGETVELFEPHSDIEEELPKLVAPSDREVRIAVNSKVMKLSHRLIAICKALLKASPVPITFWFFPGERGLFFDGLHAAIRKELPDAKIHRYTHYKHFLQQIAQCDFALSAFPFGNTNSTVDTALLGLPTIAHFGPECPAQTDKRVLETAGLPTWNVCSSDQEFYDLALSFVTDAAKRQSALGGLTRQQIRKNLIANQDVQAEKRFGQVFTQVYIHHDMISKSDKRVWTHSELSDLPAQLTVDDSIGSHD